MNALATKVALGILIAIALIDLAWLGGIMARGASEICVSEEGKAALADSKSVSCWDFWINRYQTLFTGLLSALVAAIATALVLWQLRITAHQTAMGRESVELAREEMRRSYRRQAVTALRTIARTRVEMVALMSIFPLLKDQPIKQIADTYLKRTDAFNPDHERFREEVLSVLENAEETKLFNTFEDRYSAAIKFFANVNLSEDKVYVFSSIKPNTTNPRTPLEAVTEFGVADDALGELYTKIATRIGYEETLQTPAVS